MRSSFCSFSEKTCDLALFSTWKNNFDGSFVKIPSDMGEGFQNYGYLFVGPFSKDYRIVSWGPYWRPSISGNYHVWGSRMSH